MKIGWAFTGAGHLLKESVEAMEELTKRMKTSKTNKDFFKQMEILEKDN